MDLGLEGRVFLVTGGSSGLGLAAARQLVDEGAKVVIVARADSRLDAAVTILGGPDYALGLSRDLADESAAECSVAAAVARFGRIDGSLISSGGPPAGTIASTDAAQWRSAFEEVVLGAIRAVRAVAAAAPHSDELSGTAGSSLIVLSTSVRSPIPGLAISNALRPGLAAVVKDLADEFGPNGMRVNGVAPGRFATDRVFALDAQAGSPETVRRRNEADIPLRRYGEPIEFGRLAAFMLSPAASYLTGTVVVLDGGMIRCI